MNVKDLITPVGIANYPYVTGQGDTAFSSEGQYHVKVTITKDAAEPLVKKIKSCIAAEVADEHKRKPGIEKIKRAPLPFREIGDDQIEFKFKSKFKPKIIDKKKLPLGEDKTVWSGTTMAVKFDASSYNSASLGVGCTLRLKGIQVVDLVEGSTATEGFEEIA
ncbi:ssDNA-binding protein [Candidatus Pelagibacter sp. HIMB1782]|uniref:ssDNA-binding protein n=1 Tax=Candidatus Pelagibacter sp. HIMB1782 TaxID=3413375 RepID=UPI003F842F82